MSDLRQEKKKGVRVYFPVTVTEGFDLKKIDSDPLFPRGGAGS